MSTPETVCRTCGGSPGHHVPSVLDPNGIGDPGHRIPAQGSETDSKDFDELLRRAVRPNVDTLIDQWIAQGRSEEQIYGVRNFFTGIGRVLKSPAEAGALDGGDLTIPPTPAGEGEQLIRILADHDNRQMALTDLDNWQEPHTQEAIERRMADNTMQTLAAINAYIARRVLEVIGEDEINDHEATEFMVGRAKKIRNRLRAEQRQRIAVIKKESQQ